MELTDIQVKNLISNILNEGYWGHLPLQNDSALDEFGEIAYNNNKSSYVCTLRM